MPLEYAWMQQIEVGKLSGPAPLDFLANLVLWADQLTIILDDHATRYTPPRLLVIGDEMKYEKLNLKWLGAQVVVGAGSSKAKLTAEPVELHLNNLRNDRRAGFVEAKLGTLRFELAVLYCGAWLKGGQVEIPGAAASVEEAPKGMKQPPRTRFCESTTRKPPGYGFCGAATRVDSKRFVKIGLGMSLVPEIELGKLRQERNTSTSQARWITARARSNASRN